MRHAHPVLCAFSALLLSMPTRAEGHVDAATPLVGDEGARAQDDTRSDERGPSKGERPRLLFMELDSAGVDVDDATLIHGVIAQALGRATTYELVTSSDIVALADLEADRAATGCSTASCLAELAGALDAAHVVFGKVGHLGKSLLVQLNLFDARTARPIAREEVQATSVDELPMKLRAASARLVRPIVDAGDPIVTAFAVPNTETSSLGVGAWSVIVAGSATAVVGTIALVAAATMATAAFTILVEGSPVAANASTKNGAKLVGQLAVISTPIALLVIAGGASFASASLWME